METVKIYKLIFSAVSGFFAYWLGGYDLILKTLISLSCLDFVSGVLGAFKTKSFSARKCGDGVINKIFIYIMVAVAVMVQGLIELPIREIVIVFYIVYEGTSIIENVGRFVNYPDKLKEVFIQLNGGIKNE